MEKILIEDLLTEIEEILNDIFLSGFNSIPKITLERMKSCEKDCRENGMERGSELLKNLQLELEKKIESFSSESKNLTKIFCELEFYLQVSKKIYL